MQKGDLEASFPERLIIVLEGVLALVVQEHATKRKLLRTTDTVTYHILWHEVPIKRLIVTQERYPHYEIQIVTFISQELIDQASEYLNRIDLQVNEMWYEPIDKFVATLPYQRNVRAIYDSDPENLYRFGQTGVAVIRGNDW